MDPDANLARQRELVNSIIALNGSLEIRESGKPPRAVWNYAFELAELVQALDTWIVGGGFIPRAWEVPR